MEEDIDDEQGYEGRRLLQHRRRGLSGRGLSFQERYLNTCEKRCGVTTCSTITCIKNKLYKNGPGPEVSHY